MNDIIQVKNEEIFYKKGKITKIEKRKILEEKTNGKKNKIYSNSYDFNSYFL